jgi:two-component system response regulator YesN
MKVMIVDDEIRVGNLIKNLIDWERLGLELAGVYQNGFDVLERFQHEPADILLCDIEMPEITGIELIQRISAEYPATKCIIVSGFRNFEYARQAMQYGVDYYILKPIDEDELNNTLSIICKATAEEWEKTRLERNSLLLAVQNGSYQPMSLPEINKR